MNAIKPELFFKYGLAFLTLISFSACLSTPAAPTEAPLEIKAESTPTLIPLETEIQQETGDVDLEIPCTISLWHSFNDNEINSLLSVSEAYKEINPDVEFDFLFSPNFDIRNKYENAAGSGGGPSILVGPGEWGSQFYEDSLIQDVSSLATSEQLLEVNIGTLSIVKYRDALIGLPLNIKGVLMFRNASIVSEAPQSFSNLIELAQSATTGDMIGAYLDYGVYYSAGHLEAIGGSLMDAEGNPTFNDEYGIEWVEMLKLFEEAGPIEQNTDNDINLFREGRVGIIIDDLVNAPGLADAIGPDNFVIDEWPDNMSGFIESDVVFLNANLTGHDLECGWSFMEFMLSPGAQGMFSDPSMAGFIPSVMGIDLSNTQQNQAVNAFAEGIPLPVIPEMSLYWEPLNYALQSVLEFESHPTEALSAAEQTIKENMIDLRQE